MVVKFKFKVPEQYFLHQKFEDLTNIF
jgi:hypothetical protein